MPIGLAVDVKVATGTPAFPLTLTLEYDPREPQAKDVVPELIDVFYLDPVTNAWSQQGLTLVSHDRSEGVVTFKTTHLTVFRLGVPRGAAPVLLDVRPPQARPGDTVVALGKGFSLPAAQNVFTAGGAYVTVAQDAQGVPHALALKDAGDTLMLQDAQQQELDRAALSAAPSAHSAWTRQEEGNAGSGFIDHAAAADGRLFSPGTTAAGQSFRFVAGSPTRAPQVGELVINEVLLSPPTTYLGDANGDGETNAAEDEFVELVNTTTHPLDLSGCRLLTTAGTAHVFPPGTILPGGLALVVFGVDDPQDLPRPAGPFGGQRFFPDTSAGNRLVLRLPTAPDLNGERLTAGLNFFNGGTLRQMSNPFSLQVLIPLTPSAPVFRLASAALPNLEGHALRLVRAADLDRDLDLDLVAVEGLSAVVVLLNDGQGSFTLHEDRVTPGVPHQRFVDMALADLDGDGAPELLLLDTDAAGSYGQLLALPNNGGGHFAAAVVAGALAAPASAGPAALAVGDFDADGDRDVLVSMIGDQPLRFLQDAGGAFVLVPQPPPHVDTLWFPVVPSALEAADLDADGDADIAVTAGRAGLGDAPALQLFLNDGSGTLFTVGQRGTTLAGNFDGIDALAAGDIDRDLDVDLVTGSLDVGVRLYEQTGDPAVPFAERVPDRIDALQTSAISLGDMDGDGDLDLVAAVAEGDVVYTNDGTGHFALALSLTGPAGDQRQLLVGDFDGDGDVDLLSGADRLRLWFNGGVSTNHAPQIPDLGEQPAVEGVALVVPIAVTDEDGDPLTLSATFGANDPVASVGAQFTDAGNGQGSFQWTPMTGQGMRGGKVYEFTLRANDGLLITERLLKVRVRKPNQPPTLEPVASLTVDELDLVSFMLHASDPNADDVLSYGVVNLPAGASLNSSSGAFSWMPDAMQGNGPGDQAIYPLTFTATDLDGESAQQAATITVRNKNHAPVFTPIAPLVVSEGEPVSFDVVATDEDDALPTVTLTSVFPTGASYTAGHVSWTPDFFQGRTAPYIISFEAADDGALTATLDVSIKVNNFNRPPAFSGLTDKAVNEGQLLEFTVVVNDPDGGPVVVTIDGAPPEGATFNTQSRTFAWTPAFNQAGDHVVIFLADDGAGGIATQAITIQVGNVNRPPVLNAVPDQTIREGELLQFSLSVSDPDGEALAVTVEPLPPGATLTANGSLHIFQWVPGMDQSGVYDVAAEASDGTNQVTDGFRITVVDNPGFQRLIAQVGQIAADTTPATTPLGDFGATALFQVGLGDSVGLDFGAVHPATVATLELFHSLPSIGLTEAELSLWVSDDNVTYQPYAGPAPVLSRTLNRLALSNLSAAHRYLKIHRAPSGSGAPLVNFLPQLVRASGAIPVDATLTAFLDNLQQRTFEYFSTHVNANGLIPDRVNVVAGVPTPANGAFSTAATGLWLATLPVAVERGWMSRDDAAVAARKTLKLFLGQAGGPVDGQFGFYYHFLNGDGTRFTEFSGDGVSILDSSLLFAGALACGEYFDEDIRDLAQTLYDNADWDAFYDPAREMLRLFWTPEDGFIRHLDYTSEGLLSYMLAAGSTTHPIEPSQGAPDAVHEAFHAQLAATRALIAQRMQALHAAEHADLEEARQGLLQDLLTGEAQQDAALRALVDQLITALHDGGLHPVLALLEQGGSGLDPQTQAQLLAALQEGHDDFHAALAGEIRDFLHDQVHGIDPGLEQALHAALDQIVATYHESGIHATLAAIEAAFEVELDRRHQAFHAATGESPAAGADAYYAFQQGSFGRVLGRYGEEGKPLLQSFFGSLFTYLMPPLLVDVAHERDAHNLSLYDNTREAVLANFQFAQDHPEFSYTRVNWGISAADGPFGYQGLYGTPPLDPGAGAPVHDGTVAPYALAGALPFAADLALPALQHLSAVQDATLTNDSIYGLRDGINLQRGFFALDYLGLDQGLLLVGIEQYRTGLIGQLVRSSAALQKALADLGFRASADHVLALGGPRAERAYLFLDTTDQLQQTVQVPTLPSIALAGDLLVELHPFGIDTTQDEHLVDVDVEWNGQLLRTVRFQDRRMDGTVDVGSVYVPLPQAALAPAGNQLKLTWVGGERWVQLEDIELQGPRGRQGNQETWQIGTANGNFTDFAEERLVDDSYLVGDDLKTFERALHVVDEPTTDILFELSDTGVDRLLRLVAAQTHDGRPVAVEVIVNQASLGQTVFTGASEATVDVPATLLRPGWNQITLRHANVPGHGEFLLWDALALEQQTLSGVLQVLVRHVDNDQLAPQLIFGFAPPGGAVLPGRQYLEVHYEAGPAFERLTIATDNRNAPIHRFTGPVSSPAGGLIGVTDSTIAAGLLWQVYDDKVAVAPPFTNVIEWAFVPDRSEANFDEPGARDFRSLVKGTTLAERPIAGRTGTSPIVVYLVADFRNLPGQSYTTDRLQIELIEQ